MKKTIFALGLFVFLFGCGGGGGEDAILASLQVALSGFQGGGVSGRSIRVEGGGVIYTCSQSPTIDNPNDPRCKLAAAGTGNTETPLTFTGLPTGSTYVFTEVATAGAAASGSCTITIVDSTRTDPPSPFLCTLGDITGSQLNLTISI